MMIDEYILWFVGCWLLAVGGNVIKCYAEFWLRAP